MGATMTARAWHWRIGIAAACAGGLAAVSAARTDLGVGWSIGLVAVLAGALLLALRGVHHRVDQAAARSQVFYAGEGATALLLLLMLGGSVLPGILVGGLPDPGARALVTGLLAAAVAAVASGILTATTTPERQPVPDPVRPAQRSR